MGLLDGLRPERTRSTGGRHAKPGGHAARTAAVVSHPAVGPGTPMPVHTVSPLRPDTLDLVTHNGWLPAGASVEVAGLTLPGGMLYVGGELPARNGSGQDPAIIDPRLPVDLRNPDWAGSTVSYWPSYSRISAQARGAYLTWLAGGRSHPGVPISWVFLFFYGLERRVVVDAAEPGPATSDLPLIRAEVRRLLDLYGGRSAIHSYSFHSYATQFLSLIDVLTSKADLTATAPPRTSDPCMIPRTLSVGLGRFATDGAPVPVEWALSWAHFHPQIYPRTPAQRCPEEFEQLFRARYAARYGAGMLVKPDKNVLRHTYVPASSGIGQVAISEGLPDVLQLAEPTAALSGLVSECTGVLDAYSRYLGRHPDAKDTLAAVALLPSDLVDDSNASLLRLTAWIEERLGQHRRVVVDGADLIALWSAEPPGELARAEAAAFAQLLGAAGVGVEPDVRLGGPVLGVGPAVLFRIAPGQPIMPSETYTAATLKLHLAAAVWLADGQVSDAKRARLRSHIGSAIHLTEPERVRFDAHMKWLLARQPSLIGRAKHLAKLDQIQRDSIGEFLITVATADGAISPAEIGALTRIFRLLRLDPSSVSSRVHAVTIVTAPATGPVTVRPGGDRSPGFVIPRRPADEAAGATPVRLDQAAIAAKLAETAAVSALLGSIFADDTPNSGSMSAHTSRTPETSSQPAVTRLDERHTALLRTLCAHDSWTRADLETACTALALLPDGALDTLNEAAYEAAGDPLAEGDDPIRVNLDIAREMLA